LLQITFKEAKYVYCCPSILLMTYFCSHRRLENQFLGSFKEGHFVVRIEYVKTSLPSVEHTSNFIYSNIATRFGK